MHYFNLHIGDYRSHTARHTNGQDLAYFRLLLHYYDTERELPLDVETIARRIACPVDDVRVVLTDFFHETETGWYSKRCEEEIAEYQLRSASAKKAAGRRWAKPKMRIVQNSDENF